VEAERKQVGGFFPKDVAFPHSRRQRLRATVRRPSPAVRIRLRENSERIMNGTMKKTQLILSICLLQVFAAVCVIADTYPRQLGLHVEHYTFHVKLSDASNEIVGQAMVELHFVSAGLTSFNLNLVGKQPDGKGMAVDSVTSLGQSLRFEFNNNWLRIDLPYPSKAGEFGDYTIRYHGIPAAGLLVGPNRHGDRSFDSNNWPDKARNWLPCIDHPYNKATEEMIVTAPDRYQVISNGSLVEQIDLAGDMRRTVWRESVPIATWLTSLAAAPYAVQYLGRLDGTPLETWVYPQERKVGFQAFATYAKPIFEFYSNLIGPFSYEKLANVEANGTHGGMELASDIFYGYPPGLISTLRGQQLIAHETAHQWFGDSVTENDWDDVWLSEGFATYLALVYLKHADGQEAFIEGLNRSRDFVMKFSTKHPDYTIVHKNISNLRNILTNQIYQKGAWTLHMLHDMLGAPVFWAGMREYYRRYRNGNASTADFEHVMEQVSGKNLSWFFHEWLNEGGTLKVAGHWHYDARARQLLVDLDQTQKDPLFRMPIPLGITAKGQLGVQLEPLDVRNRKNRFSIPLSVPPVSVALDPNESVLMQQTFRQR
jgi:aminopeptidase N